MSSITERSNLLRRFQKDQYRKLKRKAFDLGFHIPQTLKQYEAEVEYLALLSILPNPEDVSPIKMENGHINYVRTVEYLKETIRNSILYDENEEENDE